MAYNSGSANPMGIKTGPVTGPVPPTSEETKNAIFQDAARRNSGASGKSYSSSKPVGEVIGSKDGVISKPEGKESEEVRMPKHAEKAEEQ